MVTVVYLKSIIGIDDVLSLRPDYCGLTQVQASGTGIRSVRSFNETHRSPSARTLTPTSRREPHPRRHGRRARLGSVVPSSSLSSALTARRSRLRNQGRPAAGMNKVVLIVRSDIEADVRRRVADQHPDLDVAYVLQDTHGPKRAKPWGTGHAVLTAAPEVPARSACSTPTTTTALDLPGPRRGGGGSARRPCAARRLPTRSDAARGRRGLPRHL